MVADYVIVNSQRAASWFTRTFTSCKVMRNRGLVFGDLLYRPSLVSMASPSFIRGYRSVLREVSRTVSHLWIPIKVHVTLTVHFSHSPSNLDPTAMSPSLACCEECLKTTETSQ